MTVKFTWEGKAVPINRRAMLAKGQRRIFTNPKYQAFIKELAYTIRQQLPGVTFDGPVAVEYEQRTNHDIDALEKPLLDAIEASGLITNDRMVASVIKSRGPRRSKDRLAVTIRDI